MTTLQVDPIVADLTRRQFVGGGAVLGGALALGGCGNEGPAAQPEVPAAPSTRIVTDATGMVELPVNYERAVPLDGIYAANLYSLGVAPAALPTDVKAQLMTYRDFLPPDAAFEGLPELGIQYEINLEALAAARPDLIICDEAESESLAQYRGIAPTYAVRNANNGTWRERFARVADALGRTDRVAEVEAAFVALIASLGADRAGTTLAFVRTSDPANFRADILPTSFAGSVARAAGFTVLDVSDQISTGPEDSFVEASAEQLEILAGADLIVLGDNSFYDPADADTLSVLAKNPLWPSLPAVKAGRVVQVPGPVYNGGSYQAASALLTAIGSALGSGSAQPSPSSSPAPTTR